MTGPLKPGSGSTALPLVQRRSTMPFFSTAHQPSDRSGWSTGTSSRLRASRTTIRSTYTPRQRRSSSHGRTSVGEPAREINRTSVASLGRAKIHSPLSRYSGRSVRPLATTSSVQAASRFDSVSTLTVPAVRVVGPVTVRDGGRAHSPPRVWSRASSWAGVLLCF
jgi:hypothetical protein